MCCCMGCCVRLFTRYSAEAVAARQAKRRRREALVRQGQIAPAVGECNVETRKLGEKRLRPF